MQKLIDLIQQFDTGDIALPIMQREYVWRPRKVELLLDSLYRGWPIGSFYLWRPGKRQPKKEHHLKKPALGEPVMYLLDGQQRLASLSRAIKDASGDTLLPPPGRTLNQAMSWRVFFDAITDVLNERFILKGRKKSVERRIERNDPALLALSDFILQDDPTGLQLISNIEAALGRLVASGYIADTDAEKNAIRGKMQHVASMLNSEVLCYEIETTKLAATASAEVDVAIEIFTRLNSGGMKLSAGDVEAAHLAQETTASILGPMRDLAKDRVCVALGLNFVFLTRTLLTVRRGSARFSKLPKSWSSGLPAIEESWEATQKALGEAIDLVKRIGWTNRRWLPSANALLPVAFLASMKGGRIAKEDERETVRFLCLAAWSNAFSGASETAIDHYVRRLQKAGSRSSARVLTKAIPRSWLSRVRQEDILNESKMTGTLMQIYLAYLVSRGAKSWPSGQLLAEACKMPDQAGGIEVHHMFPRKYVENVEADFDVNTMGNYAILTKGDNASLADEDPKVVYGRLSADQKRFAREQFIPFGDEDLFLPDAYEAFTKRRAKEMAQALNGFLGL
jgi:hypothetical protein